MKTMTYSALAGIGLALASVGAPAQEANSKAQESHSADAATLAEWEYNSIYAAGGIRAEYMITEEVFGPEGEEIGNVDNAIIGGQGEIIALIVEVGGFWEIADTNIVVPWKQVKLVPDGFKVPITEDNYEEYLLFGEDSFVTMKKLQQTHPVNEVLATGAKTWKLTALLDDYVVLADGTGYGYVDDVLFTKKGKIQAVIVESALTAYGYGPYAYPFYGYAYGWQPYDSVYTLPFGLNAVSTVGVFDYGAFDGYWH